MKKILMSLVVALVTFGISAAASWKWNQLRMATCEANRTENESDAASEPEDRDIPEPPTPAVARRLPGDPTATRAGTADHGDSLMTSSSSRSGGFEDSV